MPTKLNTNETMPSNRRKILEYGSVSLATLYSGCLSSNFLSDSNGTGRQEIKFESEVSNQASEESPAVVSLKIINQSSNKVEIEPTGQGAAPLEYIEPLSGAQGEIFFYPQSNNRVDIRNGEFSHNGCWKVIDGSEGEAYLSRVSQSVPISLEPESIYSIEHEVYYHGPENVCFPEGEYEGEVSITVMTNDQRTDIPHEYSVTISEGGDIRIS